MKQAPEFFVPSWADRAKLVGVGVILWVWAESHSHWLPALFDEYGPCHDPCVYLGKARLVAVYSTLVPIAFAAWGCWRATRIFKSGQAPPPGSWELVKRRIRRGYAAKAEAMLFAAFAVASLTAAGYVAHHVQVPQLFCITTSCDCP